MTDGINLKISLEGIENSVDRCWKICNSNIDVYEIEQVMSMIDSICNAININLQYCDKTLKEGEINCKQASKIIENTSKINSLKEVKKYVEQVQVVMNNSSKAISYLYKKHNELIQILFKLKQILLNVDSEEPEVKQKVFTLLNYNVKSAYRITYSGTHVHIKYPEQQFVDSNENSNVYVKSHSSAGSNNLDYQTNENSTNPVPVYRQNVSENIISENSNCNSQIKSYSNEELSSYSPRTKSNIPFKKNKY